MNQRITCHFLMAAVISALLASPTPIHAILGEKYDATVGKALSATPRATTIHAKYTVQEMASDATVVREYLTRSGVVFGIAWKGMVQPDLTVLLGSYSGEYREAKRLQPRKHGQRRSQVQGKRVVVETWGQMRNLQGRAYAPALIPEGVTAHEIK